MNTDEVRKRFQASHPKLPTQVLNKYWGGIGYKDRTTQEQWKGYQQATKESEALQESFDAAFATCKDLHAEIKRLKAITGLLQYKASKAIDELEEVLGEDDDLVADLWYDYGKDCEGLSSVESRAKQALKEADR